MREMAKKYRDDRRGYTLVELIVTILILGIVASVMVVGISAISGTKENACAERLSRLLDQARLETMSRVDGDVWLELCVRDGSYYGILRTAGEVRREVELGPQSLRMAVKNGENEVAVISSSASFSIRFSKGSGAFLFGSGYPAFTSVQITGNRVREIVIYEETGRNSLK